RMIAPPHGDEGGLVDMAPRSVKHVYDFNVALRTVKGRGTVALQGEAGKQVLIPDGLYIVGVQTNLLSTSQLQEVAAGGSAAAARARVARVVAKAEGVVVVEAVEAVEVAEVAVGVVAGVGALVAAVVAAVGVVVAMVAAVGVVAAAVVAVGVELFRGEVLAVAKGSSSSVGARPLRLSSF
ncbi:unnamed protein product, partial [Closterium sp. NIES-54]